MTAMYEINDGRALTFDLNGKTVTGASGAAAVFKVNTGNLTIKNGTVISNGMAIRLGDKDSTNTDPTLNVLTLGEGAEIMSETSVGVFAIGYSTLNINGGEVSVGGTYAAISGNGNEYAAGTIVNITAGTITQPNDIAIYLPQKATAFNVSGGTITGTTAFYVKSGKVNVTGGTFHGTGTQASYTYRGSGANPTGDAFVIDSCNYPGGDPEITIAGGKFISDHAKAIASYAIQDDETQTGKTANRILQFISAGQFNTEPIATYLAEGKTCTESGGWYIVS